MSYPRDFKGELWDKPHADAVHKRIQQEVRFELRDECEAKITALEKTMRAGMTGLPDEQFEAAFDPAAVALTVYGERWVQETHRRWQIFRREAQDPELVAVDSYDPDVPEWSEGQAKKSEPGIPADSWLNWPRTHAVLKRNRDRCFQTVTTAGPGGQ